MNSTPENTASGPAVVAPETRDLTVLSEALVDWLGTRMPSVSAVRIENLRYPLGAGMSHETILFDTHWLEADRPVKRGMVVRIKPTRHLVYQDDMFESQYRLMQLMHRHGQVRVAEPLWFESDPALLGAPFFVMAKVVGQVAVSYPPYWQEGWLFDADAEDRRWMWHDAVTQLALIQTMPVVEAGFLTLPGKFAEGFDQELDRWRRYMDWVDRAGELPLLRDGFARLVAARPGNRPEGIVWGDARLGNMMIGDNWTVAAVMDWEQPSLGGALHDLGWWLHTDYVQTEGRGLAALEGMGTRAETIELWEAVSGQSAADIDWYQIFAAFKMECLAVRLATMRSLPKMAPPGTQTARFLDHGIAPSG